MFHIYFIFPTHCWYSLLSFSVYGRQTLNNSFFGFVRLFTIHMSNVFGDDVLDLSCIFVSLIVTRPFSGGGPGNTLWSLFSHGRFHVTFASSILTTTSIIIIVITVVIIVNHYHNRRHFHHQVSSDDTVPGWWTGGHSISSTRASQCFLLQICIVVTHRLTTMS